MQFEYFICKEKKVLIAVDRSHDYLAVYNKVKKVWEISKDKFADYQKYTLTSHYEYNVLVFTKGVSPESLFIKE